MKRLALLFLLLFVLPVPAQKMSTIEEQKAELEKLQASQREFIRKQIEIEKKIQSRMASHLPKIAADEKSLPLVLFSEDFNNEEFLAYTHMTKEKAAEIRKKMTESMREFVRTMQDIQAEMRKTNVPEELDKLADQMMEGIYQAVTVQSDIFREELTPQQLDKLKELRLILATPNAGGANMLFDFGQYETLNLTAEQQKKIDAIREEYEKEFPLLMEKMGAAEMKQMEQSVETGFEQSIPSEELKKLEKEATEASILVMQLNSRTRTKILAVLTKEQSGRMEKILAGAPKYLVKRFGLEKKQDDSWKDSWRPGDPIPDSIKKTPRKSFPIGF